VIKEHTLGKGKTMQLGLEGLKGGGGTYISTGEKSMTGKKKRREQKVLSLSQVEKTKVPKGGGSNTWGRKKKKKEWEEKKKNAGELDKMKKTKNQNRGID